ncbi:hypothetical protein J4Q44_G00008760 [Coregonus suidteri]|uniref:Uncharacterized protein n=1 Tax=Coregonus suidteri TaxID=861788 RepID=A0AAN8MLJ2_9TELE
MPSGWRWLGGMPSTKSSSSKTLTRPLASCPVWHCKPRRWTITLSGLTCTTRSRSHSAHMTVGASLRETSLWLPSLTKHLSSKQLMACCHFSLSAPVISVPVISMVEPRAEHAYSSLSIRSFR